MFEPILALLQIQSTTHSLIKLFTQLLFWVPSSFLLISGILLHRLHFITEYHCSSLGRKGEPWYQMDLKPLTWNLKLVRFFYAQSLIPILLPPTNYSIHAHNPRDGLIEMLHNSCIFFFFFVHLRFPCLELLGFIFQPLSRLGIDSFNFIDLIGD